MSLYQKYAPPLGAMPLLVFLAVYIILPYFYAPVGLTFGLLTLALIVGVQPHIDKLSEGGHEIPLALNKAHFKILAFQITLWERHEWKMKFHIANKQRANGIVTGFILLFTFLFVPLVLWIIQKQGTIFANRIEARWDTIMTGFSQLTESVSGVLPEWLLPADENGGHGQNLFEMIFAQVFGDVKHLVTEVSTEAALIFGHLLKGWFEIIIAMILLGVLVKGWHKEIGVQRARIADAVTNTTMQRRVFRFAAHYQEALSILVIGYLEVGLTLSVYYFVVMMVLPLNLGIGFTAMMAFFFGYMTAVWKIGGIATKIISPFLIMLYFQDGFGWFGYTLFSINLGVDLILKGCIMFCIAFYGGYLEAYNYTPEIVGKELGLTKMEMVMIILIWAIGAGFMGMIWGVLMVLLLPAFIKLLREEQEQSEQAA